MAEPTIAIVTDSTADLPPALAQELGVTVVPLMVNFGSEGFRDGIDLKSEHFWTKMAAAPALPTTSQPSVAAFDAAYRPLLGADRSIVSIHLAGKLSGTVRSAQMAAEGLTDAPITIIDSGTASMALGWLVVMAAEMARQGAPAESIVSTVNANLAKIGIYALLDTLENLRRGGRIGRAGAFIGALLNIKPIVAIRDGEVQPLERVRTRGKAISRLVEMALAQQPLARVAVCHGNDPAGAKQVADLLRPHVATDILTTEIGPVVGTHAGPGVIGIAFLRA